MANKYSAIDPKIELAGRVAITASTAPSTAVTRAADASSATVCPVNAATARTKTNTGQMRRRPPQRCVRPTANTTIISAAAGRPSQSGAPTAATDVPAANVPTSNATNQMATEVRCNAAE